MVVPESETVVVVAGDAAETQEEEVKDSSLGGQNNSVFSLTLDEIQCKSGKSFGSMNMDEFLASVWSVEENQSQTIEGDPNSNNKTLIGPQTTNPLARQGSLSIPISLCNKTVDEVWFEIHKDQTPQQQQQHKPDNNNIQRQQTLGEITLEDFLIKAGVVQETEKKMQVVPIQEQLVNHQIDANAGAGMGQHVMGLGYAANGSNGVSPGNGFLTYQMYPTKSGTFAGETSNGNGNIDDQRCHGLIMDPGGHKITRKRIIDGPPEVVVERRQRRMIKNRESAARSRARRQAYTVELELELNQLREENAKLKQILEELDQKRKEEVVKRKARNDRTKAQKTAEKLRTIRRAVSLAW